MSSDNADLDNPLEDVPRLRPRRRRERLVLPNWAWPLLGVICLLLGLVLGWFLWKPAPEPEASVDVPTSTATVAPSSTPSPIPATATVTPSPSPTVTASPTAMPTQTNTPEPTGTPTVAPVSTVAVGVRVKVSNVGSTGLRLRSGAGLNFITWKIIDEGTILEVIGGPEKNDNYTWWRVKDDKGVIGWAVADFLVPVP